MSEPSALVARLNALMVLDPSAGVIEFEGRWTTWGQLSNLIARVNQLLDQAQLGPDSAVGMLLRNRPALLSSALAVLMTQRCVLTISPSQPVASLAEQLMTLQAPVLVMDAQDWQQPAVQAAARGSQVIVVGVSDGVLTAELALGHERCTHAAPHAVLPGTGILMLSSGTTGTPKRIPLAFKSFEQAILGATFYESGGKDGNVALKQSPAILSMPLVHIGGLWTAVLNLASGRAMVLLERFTVERFERAALAYKPKMVSLPPTALRMIYDAQVPKTSLASLMAIRTGSAPLDPDFAQLFEARYGMPLLDAYGATEFAGGVAGWTWPDHQRWGAQKRGSVGRANPGVTLRIVDRETRTELPHGGVGLLEVKAPQLGSTEWVSTTDLAELDADGFLYIRGRSDDAIIRGGFKVLPATVVDVLRKHPAVLDASVVGMPDERLGAVPMAAVELRAGTAAPPEAELQAFVREHLAPYQVPTCIRVVPSLPRTPSMKVSQPGVKALLANPEPGPTHASA